MKMAEEIISAMLSAQDTNPEDLIDDGSGTDSEGLSLTPLDRESE